MSSQSRHVRRILFAERQECRTTTESRIGEVRDHVAATRGDLEAVTSEFRPAVNKNLRMGAGSPFGMPRFTRGLEARTPPRPLAACLPDWNRISAGSGLFGPPRTLNRTVSALLALLFALCSSAESQTPRELAAQAGSAMRHGDYRAAELKYVELIEHMPNVAELHSNLGLAQLSLGDLRGAEASFRTALQLDPGVTAAKFLLGRILFQSSRYEEAARLLESAAADHPGQPTIARLLAASWIGLERYDDASSQYDKLLEADPNDTEALYGLGKLYLHRGQQAFDLLADFEDSAFYLLANADFHAERPRFTELAEDFYLRAVEAEPGHAGLRSALGMFLLRRRDWKAAQEAFGQALERDPQAYEALFGGAFARLAGGDWEGAAADIASAAQIRPEFFRPPPAPPVDELDALVRDPLLNKGDFGSAYLRWVFTGEQPLPPTGVSRLPPSGLERMRELLKVGRYEEVTRMHGVNGPEAIYLRGAAYRQLGLSILGRLMEESPDTARAHQLLADSLHAENRFGEAAAEYEAALDRQPGDPVLLLSLANTRLREPKYRLATEAYRQVIAVAPANAEAFYNLGIALVAQNLHREALTPLRRALALQPDLRLAHATLGKALAALGEVEKAVEHLEAGASTDEDGTLHYQLFQAYRKLGLAEKAEAARQRSAELRP